MAGRGWIVGGCCALVGCQQSFRLQGRDVPTVVARYHHGRKVELDSRGERFVITPAQQPRLRIASDTCRAPEGQTVDASADCGESEAPLAEARLVGEGLLLPGAPAVPSSQVIGGEIFVDGEEARPLPRPRVDSALPAAPREQPVPEPRRSRAYFGVQLGGSGAVQLAFRGALVGPLHLELGVLAWGPGFFVNGSAGLALELPLARGWAPYVAGGGGAWYVAGHSEQEPCDEPRDPCPSTAEHASRVFGYARVGVAKYFGRHRVAADAGVWLGRESDGPPERSERFLWPMLGASYHYAL